MKVTAFVPIKLNSQRLPRKNILPIAGKPLCSYICNTLCEVKAIDEVYVFSSTASIVEYLPRGIKFLKRPEWLDGDTVKGYDIYSEFIKQVDSDIYVLAHTTSPFIKAESIENALSQVLSGKYDSAFSAQRIQTFSWFKGEPINYNFEDVPRTQDIDPIWVETSAFYIFSKKLFVGQGRRIGNTPYIQEVSGSESIDIDEEKDYKFACSIAKGIKTVSFKDFVIIAGPCVIESEENVMFIAEKMKDISERLGFDYYFKASFDKANRTSISSYRGPGIEEGLRILRKVKDTYGLKICTDIHEPWQAEKVAQVADIIQIPAFLCRQTDLLIAAAKTGKVINIKKAQFLAPWDMGNVIKKLEDSGNRNIMLCERGTSFGYNALVVDMASIPEMKKFGYPVVFDATHSVQKPGGNGTFTSGNREYIKPLAKAAVAAGADALFFEVHPDPDNAMSDGANMVRLDDFEALLEEVLVLSSMQDRSSLNFSSTQISNHQNKSVKLLSPSLKSDQVIHKYSLNKKSVDIIKEGQIVFDTEITALQSMRNEIGVIFEKIVNCITKCKGKIIITGMGKPGRIGTKIAATLSSLGTPSFFLHPAEAMHGDLGMISQEDIVVAISYSGESDEIVHILPNIKMIGAMLVALTGNPKSTLALAADLTQVLPAFEEACYLGLAPTSSTTVELVYGDALAVASSAVYGFKDADFGKFHPAGSLGKKLILRVSDLMAKGVNNPKVSENSSIKDAIIQISKHQMGMVAVVDDNDFVVGVITDGDLRRILEKGLDIYSLFVQDVMTMTPITVNEDELAVVALRIMNERNINCMPVLKENKLIGGIKMQTIINAGIVDNSEWGVLPKSDF